MNNTRVKRPPPDLLKTDETLNQKHSIVAEELIEINKVLADLNLLSSENVFELSENIFYYQRSFEDDTKRLNSLEEYYRLKGKIAENEDWLFSHKKFDDFYDNLDTSDTFPIIAETYDKIFHELYSYNDYDAILKRIQTLCYSYNYHPIILFSKRLINIDIRYSTSTYRNTFTITKRPFENLSFELPRNINYHTKLNNPTNKNFLISPLIKSSENYYYFKFLDIYSILFAITSQIDNLDSPSYSYNTADWEIFIRKLNTQIALKNIGLLNYKLETFIRQCKIEEMRKTI